MREITGDAIKMVDRVDDLVAPDGSTQRFVGRVLQWDTVKAASVGLEFDVPWFAQREIELCIWSTAPATVEVNAIALKGTTPLRITLAPMACVLERYSVHPDKPVKGNTVRLSLNTPDGAAAGALVCFGLEDHGSIYTTAARARLASSAALWLYLSTWVNLACVMLIVMVGIGFKANGALATTLVLVPTILERLGFAWASKFSPGAIAQWLRRQMPMLVSAWRVCTVPLVAGVAYILIAFTFFALYERTLDEHLADTKTPIADRAEFFCRYPERLETRVLLARHLDLIRADDKSLVGEYTAATAQVGQARFLTECLTRVRLLRWFAADAPSQETHARILYASLVWNPITDSNDLAVKLARIEEVLGVSAGDAGALRQITLAKYKLKAIKNAYEHGRCQVAAAPACVEGRNACLAARTELGALLDRAWTAEERTTVAYLEAHDVMASAHMSIACTHGRTEDGEAALRHYQKLVYALSRTGPQLEQPLTQINFRKFIDAQIDQEPAHATARQWKKDCASILRDTCRRIAEAFAIKDSKRAYFEQDPSQRAKSWGQATLTNLDDETLKRRLLDQKEKGWRWPL